MSRTITFYLRFIDELCHIIESGLDAEKSEGNKEKLEKIHIKYNKYQNHVMPEKKRILHSQERALSISENADFSTNSVIASIKEGELKTIHILKDIKLS
jgi:hypothetical protein